MHFWSTLFKTLIFQLSTTTGTFSKRCVFKRHYFWNLFSKVFVFISVFGRSSVDGRRKQIKKCAFLMYGCEEILVCDHSNESHWAALPRGTVYYVVQGGSNFLTFCFLTLYMQIEVWLFFFSCKFENSLLVFFKYKNRSHSINKIKNFVYDTWLIHI